jgi:hypothetical protein
VTRRAHDDHGAIAELSAQHRRDATRVRSVADDDDLARTRRLRPPHERTYATVGAVASAFDDDGVARHTETREHEQRALAHARNVDVELREHSLVGAGGRFQHHHAGSMTGAVEIGGLGGAENDAAGEHDDRVGSTRGALFDDQATEGSEHRDAQHPQHAERYEE